MPSKFKGCFDKIHVGGTCREDRLTSVIQLLRSEGGKIIVPVEEDLRLITKYGPPSPYIAKASSSCGQCRLLACSLTLRDW